MEKSRSLVIPARRAVNKGPAGSAPVKSPAACFTRLGGISWRMGDSLPPSRTALRNPRRGFLTENSPLDCFSIFLRLPKATKAVGRRPTPCKPFEKGLSENFTRLRRGRAFSSRSGAAFRRRPKARIAQSEHGPAITLSPCTSTSRTCRTCPARSSSLSSSTWV